MKLSWSVKKKDETPKVPARLLNNAKKAIALTSINTVNFLRIQHLTGGTTQDRLRRRSGKLAASTKPVIPVKVRGSVAEGGVMFGTKYAAVHIGTKGGSTVIKPKKKKWLTIPLPAALTTAGVVKGSALSGKWGGTFFAKSKKGNLILFGRQAITKGKRQGQLRGKVLPLFVLKKQVVVKVRVTFKSIFDYAKPRLIESLKYFGLKM